MLRETSIEPHYIYPECNELCSTLDSLIWYQDGTVWINQQLCSVGCFFRLRKKKGMKVMLDGQGADEILLGYADFVFAVGSTYLRRLKIFPLLQEVYCASRRLRIPGVTIFSEIMYYALPSRLRSLLTGMLFAGKYSPAWINPDFLKQIDIAHSLSYIPIESDIGSPLSKKP